MSVAMQERDGAVQRLTEDVARAQKKLTEAEEKITALEAAQRDLSWYGPRAGNTFHPVDSRSQPNGAILGVPATQRDPRVCVGCRGNITGEDGC